MVRATCQYPFARSRMKMKHALLRQFTRSSTQGRGLAVKLHDLVEALEVVADLEGAVWHRAIIDLALDGLSFQHVLSNNGGYFVDLLLHLLHIFYHCLEQEGLFFPVFMYHIGQTPGSSSEE